MGSYHSVFVCQGYSTKDYSSNGTQQLCRCRNLSGNSAQAIRTALINANHQPGDIADAGDTISRSKLSDAHILGMIELTDRHIFVSLCFVDNNKEYKFRADHRFS
jgi:hypothetical protein